MVKAMEAYNKMQDDLREKGLENVRRMYLEQEILYYLGEVLEEGELKTSIENKIDKIGLENFVYEIINYEKSVDSGYTMDFEGIDDLITDYFNSID